MMFYIFFFQAEDGIRDADVTGVQTCALPIWCDIRPGRKATDSSPIIRSAAGNGSGTTTADKPVMPLHSFPSVPESSRYWRKSERGLQRRYLPLQFQTDEPHRQSVFARTKKQRNRYGREYIYHQS